jgi:curved DNA-binding protein CbpA
LSHTNIVDSKTFDSIQRAYSILSDPARRALYDRWRTSHLRIPFEVFEGLGAHAQVIVYLPFSVLSDCSSITFVIPIFFQTLHWQSLPSQQTITAASDTVSSATQVNQSIPLSNGREADRIQIQPVWKANDSDALYDKFRNYEL